MVRLLTSLPLVPKRRARPARGGIGLGFRIPAAAVLSGRAAVFFGALAGHIAGQVQETDGRRLFAWLTIASQGPSPSGPVSRVAHPHTDVMVGT